MENIKAIKRLTTLAFVAFLTVLAMQPNTEAVKVDLPPITDSSYFVLENTPCEDVPEGEFPTGVIYRVYNGGSYFSAKPAIVHNALEDALGGKDWTGHAAIKFCK